MKGRGNQVYQKQALSSLIDELEGVRERARAIEERYRELCADKPKAYRDSAYNLLHYLALRQCDMRPLQESLHRLGLSSLGRLEPYVLPSLEAVLKALHALMGQPYALSGGPPDLAAVRSLLRRRTAALLGKSRQSPRIMVTLPNAAADHPGLLRELLECGMDVMRVNCSKGGPAEWNGLMERLRLAEQETGRKCKTQFDLEGPNPRTAKVKRKLKLREGDRLLIRMSEAQGRQIVRGCDSESKERPAEIGINLPEVFRHARTGHRVLFDDGKLRGVIESIDENGALARIVSAEGGRAKLGGGKGINLPDTKLDLPSLTEKDMSDLDFVAANADIVGLSFARRPEDIEQLREELERRGGRGLGLVLKIETRQAFEALPLLLLSALGRQPLGVMIARGDMGAELGFARMAEVQEEMLWLCEAAHVPVIWATQVLESLSKKGVPTRGDITDAAQSVRAECVMLNKGAHVVDTVRFLSDLHERMSRHHRKKWALLRRLKVADLEL